LHDSLEVIPVALQEVRRPERGQIADPAGIMPSSSRRRGILRRGQSERKRWTKWCQNAVVPRRVGNNVIVHSPEALPDELHCTRFSPGRITALQTTGEQRA
jgi:hypothetical protein